MLLLNHLEHYLTDVRLQCAYGLLSSEVTLDLKSQVYALLGGPIYHQAMMCNKALLDYVTPLAQARG